MNFSLIILQFFFCYKKYLIFILSKKRNLVYMYFLFYTLKLLQYIYQKILNKNTDKKNRNKC